MYNQIMARQKEYDDMFIAVFDIKGTIPEDEFEKKLAAVRLEVANKIDAYKCGTLGRDQCT
jgi:hypothetical protein